MDDVPDAAGVCVARRDGADPAAFRRRQAVVVVERPQGLQEVLAGVLAALGQRGLGGVQPGGITLAAVLQGIGDTQNRIMWASNAAVGASAVSLYGRRSARSM